MKHRDIVSNTFEGGMDLDSDNKVIPSNKYREAYNVDIRKSGNVFSLTDLRGETILAVIEDVSLYSVTILNVTEAQFFTSPTSTTETALVFFYTKHRGSDRKFIIKAIFMSDFRQTILFSEDLSNDELDILLKSTIDVQKVGQYGYDILYFVDNRRQPRRLECVVHTTNESEVSIYLESITDGNGFKTVRVRLESSVVAKDEFRAYVYSYLEGSSTENTVNPLTEKIKYATFSTIDTEKFIDFRVYEEDYGNRYFQIRHHKEGLDNHRNFIIGDPSILEVPLGVLVDTFTIMSDSYLLGANTSTGSWDFLYDGKVINAYISEPIVNLGFTKIYKNNIAYSGNLIKDGYYQAITTPGENKYIRVQDGNIMEYRINWATVEFKSTPLEIESQVRSASTVITEGMFNRLDTLTYNIPSTLTVGGVEYTMDDITTSTKSSIITPFSYVMEKNGDQYPIAHYSDGSIYLRGSVSNISNTDVNQYTMTIKGSVTRPLDAELTCTVRQRIYMDGVEQEPASAFIVIAQGDLEGYQQINYTSNGPIQFGQVCVVLHSYSGSDPLIAENTCPI